MLTGITTIINGFLALTRWLETQGVNRHDLQKLLGGAMDRGGDISEDELDELLGGAQSSIDELSEAIDAATETEPGAENIAPAEPLEPGVIDPEAETIEGDPVEDIS